MMTVKALGIKWNTGSDTFSFDVNLPKTTSQNVTKRIMLSETAKLYDPLGWLSPLIINAKILLQQLWSLGLQWDQGLSQSILDTWLSFRKQLFDVERIVIPRLITLRHAVYELYGFGDASEQAFASVIYLRSQLPCGAIKVHLLKYLTKFAPL